MGDHLALSLGIDRATSPTASLLPSLISLALPMRSTGAGLRRKLIEALVVTACATRPISPTIATNRATSQTANIAGPEIVPPGRKRLG